MRGVCDQITFVHSYHDIRLAQAVNSKNRVFVGIMRQMFSAIGCIAVGCFIFNRLHLWLPLTGWMLTHCQCVAAAVVLYNGLLLVDVQYRLPLLAVNLQVPSTFRNPIRSASLREFWGRRWNKVIQTMLTNAYFWISANIFWNLKLHNLMLYSGI